MTDAAIAVPQAAIPQAAGTASKGRRLRRRHLWLVPGLAIAIYANLLGGEHGVGIVELVLFGIAPDLPRLLRRFVGGAGVVAIRVSNVLHQPLVAFAALAIAAAGAVSSIVPIVVLVATLVWSSHVVIGWGVGDGIRHPDGSVRR